MKYILVLAILFSVTVVFSQKHKKDSMPDQEKKEVGGGATEPPPLTPKPESETVKKYEERLKDASNTISLLNSAITAVSVGITLFFGVAGLAVYLFGIKPSQDAVKELNENMDRKIALYVENNHKEAIENSVKKIASGNNSEVFSALTYLQAEPNLKLNDEQIFRLIKPLRREIVDQAIKENVGPFVANIKSPVVDDFFSEKLNSKEKDFQWINMATIHFTLEEYKGDLSLFEKTMSSFVNSKDRSDYYGYLLSHSHSSNKSWLIPILNSHQLVDAAESGESIEFHRGDFGKYSDLNLSDYKDTYFFRKR